MKHLLLGTSNRKKGIELQSLLEPYGFRLTTLADHPTAMDVVEDGDTFEANARLKATQQAKHLGCWVVGEDSGLLVDALDGAPGIYTARYSGPDATDDSNNQKLLQELGSLPLKKRTAHYLSHITLADPEGQVHIDCEAPCHGRIRFEYAGTGGFGYDPIFEVVEYHQTFAQLGPYVKSLISHRAKAMRRFLPHLMRIAQEANWKDA